MVVCNVCRVDDLFYSGCDDYYLVCENDNATIHSNVSDNGYVFRVFVVFRDDGDFDIDDFGVLLLLLLRGLGGGVTITTGKGVVSFFNKRMSIRLALLVQPLSLLNFLKYLSASMTALSKSSDLAV